MNKSDAEKILDRVADSDAAALLVKVGAATALVTHGAPVGLDVAVVGCIDGLRSMWTKRQTELTVNVVAELEALKIDVQKLIAENEHFGTVFTMAIREAVATHEQDKIEALKNAVVNTAVGIDIDEEIQLILLAKIGEMSAAHIRVLRAYAEYEDGDFNKPIGMDEQVTTYGAIAGSGKRINEEYGTVSELSGAVSNDLQTRGLLTVDPTGPRRVTPRDGRIPTPLPDYAKITTLGTKLLAYLDEH